ncbi:ATP-binding cassette domain-containing protein [Rhodobacter capsulatus]|uniref:ATP-binding cassette domain-containing protein n=1 Tax=Rhodobacter capsulatus TaxID=1061 RepID=UPI0003D33CF5|nr:ATP-binding cassette domain-containing protein [Rhodobacter capsulatus]ETD83460.1 ABC transporter [Rhodobacter capsulatus YW1]
MSKRGVLGIDRLSTTLSKGERSFTLRVAALELVSGEVLCVTGASGTGKTLFLELLSLLRAPEPPAGYHWTAPDRRRTDLARLWRFGARGTGLARMRGALFGFVPQAGALVPFLSVRANVALTQRISGRRDPARVAVLLDRLGLNALADLPPAALSIGQRQRVSIARALAHRPAFVIADEPTAALDPAAADAVMRLLLDTAREDGAGVVLSSHDLARIEGLGPRRLEFVARELRPGLVRSEAREVRC